MADDENPEETPATVPETNDGENAEAPDQGEAVNEAPSGESATQSVEIPVDHKEHLTPYRAAKLAGIGVLAALVVAVIVVAAVWAISAIADESHDADEYYERQDSDDAWFQYADPSGRDDDFDGYQRGPGRGSFGYDKQWDKRWDWADKDHFAKPGSSAGGDPCERPFGFDARTGGVVVVVLGGPSGWGAAGGFGSGGRGVGAGEVLPNIVPFAQGEGFFGGEWSEGLNVEGFFGGPGPTDLGGFYGGLGAELLVPELFAQFFEDPSVLEGFFGVQGLEIPELYEESSLGVTELDNFAPSTVEGLAPT